MDNRGDEDGERIDDEEHDSDGIDWPGTPELDSKGSADAEGTYDDEDDDNGIDRLGKTLMPFFNCLRENSLHTFR